MTQCCDDFGQCQHGPGCPTGIITQAPRTCEALGVCQNPDRECNGACELPPKLPGELRDDLAQPTRPLAFVKIDAAEICIAALIVMAVGGVAAMRIFA